MHVDYLVKYSKDGEFDLPALINDDFFQPVRILFNAKQYVSSAKLLLVAIDSIGYIEFGDVGDNTFLKWLNEYTQIEKLGITAEELWEHRNSLLHMSNLYSRKVSKGKIRALVSYVGELHPDVNLSESEFGCYDLRKLIDIIGEGCGRWFLTYTKKSGKFQNFVERYDLIASDSRLLQFEQSS